MAIDKCTLLIRHLPPDLRPEHVEELMKTVGAVGVRVVAVRGEKRRIVAYATFDNPTAAESALQRLHQLELCGRRLVVIYAPEGQIPSVDPTVGRHNKDDNVAGVQKSEERMTVPTDIMRNIGQISELLGINYPFAPHLCYCYPDPTPGTIHNIAVALVSVPKLYWQVLHLMNKMNLPPPFASSEQSLQKPFTFDHLWPFNQQQPVVGAANSDEESELESDHDNDSLGPTLLATKRKRPSTAPKVSKRSRIHSLLVHKPVLGDSVAQPTIPPADVFDLTNPQSVKKIEFKISTEAIAGKTHKEEQVDIAASVDQGSFGTFTAASENSDTNNEETVSDSTLYVTDKILRENRISVEGMALLPVFKNYQSGKASAKLYLKNLAKVVEEKDLQFIYGRYVAHLADDMTEMFNIRLMKEGRMKGQAFITFPNEVIAASALQDTNGYMLHGKPIVVQYAHQSKP